MSIKIVIPLPPNRKGQGMIIVIPGKPHAQGRHRAVRMGKSVRMYDHPASAKWKKMAAKEMMAQRTGSPWIASEPLLLRIRAMYPLPRSSWRQLAPIPVRWRIERPDVDNIAKAVMDAAQGVLFGDDSQVVRLEVDKLVCAQGEEPRVEITVEQLGEYE